jgi:L-lysine exporter family protein LysE/ArgO
MTAYLSGLLLGLVIVLPIGAESLFVLNQGMRAGFPRALVSVSTVCLCDTFLIVLGAAGASALLTTLGYQEVLIAVGSTFLVIVGVLTLRARPQHGEAKPLTHVAATSAQAVGVSLFNPHAILDTIGIIGGAIAAQAAEERIAFGAGTVSASWLWFFALCIGASAIRPVLTSRVRLWIQRSSGVLMLVFAGILVIGLT